MTDTMTTTAMRLIEAIDSADQSAISRAFDAFHEVRGFELGDRVHAVGYVPTPRFGGGYGEVVRVNRTTVTVRLFADPTYEVRVPLDASRADCRRDFHATEASARELVGRLELEAPVVVIPCGGEKATARSVVAELYVGSYFRALLAAARAITTDDRIFVLSGLHGFLLLDEVIDPYEQRIDEPGAVTDADLRVQVHELAAPLAAAAAGRAPVTVLAGSAYVERALLALGARARVELPFAGSRGIGDHLARAKAIAA